MWDTLWDSFDVGQETQMWDSPTQCRTSGHLTLMEILIDFQHDFIFAPKLLVLPTAASLKC